MKKKLLTIALSFLMIFNCLPSGPLTVVSAEGEEIEETEILETPETTEISEDYEIPVDETEEVSEEDPGVIEEPVETGDPVIHEEPTEDPSEDPFVDYVKTEDEDVFSLTLHGEAAEDPAAAEEFILEHTDLKIEEVKEVVATLFADPQNDAPEETRASEADGTKIIGITTKWITPDTVDNGDDNLLYVKPADASDQTIKLQINYSLAGEHDYEAGDVRIKIPAEIFWGRPDENGKRDPLGTMVLPFPEAPDTSSDFNYEFIEDKVNGNYYLLTNTKKMEAATKGHIRIAFTDLSPYDVVDMQESDPFDAEIFVKVHTGKTISLGSNAITAQFDTEAKVVPGSGSKRVKDKIIIVGPDSIPSKQRIDGEEAYVLVKYYAWATIEANTRYTLSVRDFIPDEFGGFVLNATSADGREKDNGVVYEGTKNGKTVYYWFTVAYPVSKFTPDVEVTLHNNVEFKVTEVDPESAVANPNVQDPDPQLVTIEIAPCNPHYTYRLPTWVDPPGHYNIWKNGNDGKAKGNITRAVNAADTDRTRSDLLIGTSGYYGIYPSALNDLQDGKDVEVSYTVDTLGYVFPWTYKEVTPGTGHEEADGTWVWDIPAARIISNYLQRKVKMETVDMGTRLERYGDMLKVGTDYEFVSLEFPNPRIYKGEPHNINPDGSWQALSYDDGTFLYTQDSDLTKVPVYNVEIMRNGVWEPYATVSWESGSRVITKTDGTVVSGSVLDLPAGTENWHNIIVTEKIAAIWYDIRVVIRFKPSATVMAAVDHQFEVTTTPRLDFWNNADLIATREDTGELIVDIKDIPTQGGHPKDGFNELDGYTTDTEVYPYKEAEQNIKDIDFSTNTINIKYSARVEVNSVIKEKRSFEQAIADGRLDVATHGYWYDLLPEGVRYKEGTVKVRDGDQIVDVYPRMVEHNGVKRQMLVVEVNLTPTPVRYQEGDTFYYQDVPSIEFWAEYSLDNMSAYGDTIHNVIAFEADLDEFGTIENYRGEPDDPTLTNHNNIATELAFDNDGEKQMMKNLDPDRDTPSFVYAGVYTTIDEVDATRTYLRKDVDVNGENNYTSGIYYDNPEKNRRDVYEGGNYSYRLLFGNNDETISSDIRLFDSLETFHAAQGNDDIDIDKPVWKGTFNGVDVHNLVEKGCEPEVYYATENLPLEIPDPAAATGIKWHPTNTNLKDTSIWTNAKNYTGDLADVKMVAIDATKKADGSDFELQPDDSFMVYINMIAPSGEEARRLIAENGHAYNNSYMQASARAYSAQNPEFTDMYVRQDYTKVGMIEHKLTVEKEWDDQNNRDGLRPVNVVFHLLANKVDTGKTLTLPIIDEEGNKVWVGYFDNIPYADANGPIRYSVTEDFIDAYTGELIKENDQTFKFVNRHEPEKINVPGLKTWVGDDPTKRPSTLTIHLFADGVEIQKKNVKADPDTGEWNYVFEGLYKYKEGEVRVPIVYTVTEEVTGLVSSYVPEYNGMNIINRYHPYGDLYLEKEISNLADILNNAAAINKTFEFNFEFVKKVDGEDVPIDTNYEYDILEGDTVVSSGWIGVDYTWSISIRYDQKIHVKEIDENAHYTITETNGKGFRLITSSGAAGVVLPNQTSNAKFVNEYKAKGHASLKAVKRLDCGIMEADQFSFTVYGEDGSVVKTTTNRDIEVVYNEDGSVSYSVSPVNFSTINYTEKDAGKTYRYKIVEAVKTDGTDGIIFDRTEFFAVVTVEDKEGNGELDVQVKYYDADGNELQDITFENEYRAEGKKVLTAWKVLQGRDLKDEEFTFELLAPNEKGIWEVIDSATNHGSIVSFKELEFNQNDNGKTFYYLVREVKGNDDTVVYDEGYFGYKLTVTDTSHGTLNIEQTMVDPDTIERGEKDEIINVTWKDGEGSMPVFRNALLPGILRIVKYIDPESEDYDPDQEFTFHVELTGTDLPDDQLPYTITKLDSQFPPVEEPIGPVFPGSAVVGNNVDGVNQLLGDAVDANPLAGNARRLNSETYHATDEELTGTAYAVLDADGNLIFFRSNEDYKAGADQTVTDIKGNTYTGTIYTDFENTDQIRNIWNKSAVKTITVAEGQAIRPVSLVSYGVNYNGNKYWQSTYFCDMGNLVKADLSRFDTSLVTNLQYMFRNCSKLEELDLSTWDVSNVTGGMGTYEYSSIQTANGQSYVFRGCTNLEKLDISNWNPNAGYYSNLFANLTNLTELKLENVHFRGAGWAPFLFANLKSLEVLDLSTFYLDRGGRWANHTGIFQGSVFKEFSINSSFRFVQADGNFYTHSPAPALPTPTGEGYSGRWVKKYEDSAGYYPGSFPWSFNNDSVGMAGTWVWESDIFTVSFVADNAVGSMNDQMFSAIKNCKLPANQYVRFGYEFDHWVDEENGYEYEDTGMIPEGRYKMGDHIILKAVFKEIETHVDVSDGSFDITLKGGEMATIYNLPAGTSYNVTEINIPDGWSLVGVRDNSGVIDSFKTITAYFTDKYSPSIATAQIHGMKLLDGRPAEPFIYHFRMTADNETEVALAGGRFEDTLFMPFDIWAQEGGHLNFPIFLYKEPGVHTYRIREIAPNDNNVIWDSHEEVVTVTVFERDGNLVAEVQYDDDGFVFNNKTRPGELRIHKLGNVDENTKDDEFTFKVTFTDSTGFPLKDGEVFNWYVEGRTEEVPAANGEIVDHEDKDTGDIDPSGKIIGSFDKPAVHLNAYNEPIAENEAVLTFNGNGGYLNYNGEEVEEYSRKYDSTSYYIYTPGPWDARRDGYALVGWTTEPDGSGVRYDAGYSIRPGNLLVLGQEVILYAQWAETADVTIKHYKQNDTLDGYTLTDTVVEKGIIGEKFTGEIMDQYRNPDYYGYETRGEKVIVVSEDPSVNVIEYQYNVVSYAIHFDGNGADSGTMEDLRIHLKGGRGLIPNRYVRDGYLFLGWNTKADGSGDSFKDAQYVEGLSATPGEHVTLYAQWHEAEETQTKDGAIYVKCKAGETVVIPNIKQGTNYSVEEIELPENWVLERIENQSGIIKGEEAVDVYVTNKHTYKPAYVSLIAYKNLIGREIKEGEFTFELTDSNGKVIQTAENGMVDDEEYLLNEDGDPILDGEGNPVKNPAYGRSIARFAQIAYTEADIGYRYTYYIHEKLGTDDTVQYDMTEYKVTVELTAGADGRVKADVKYYLKDDLADPLFTNKLVPGNLDIYKITADGTADQDFSFKVEFKDADGKDLETTFTGIRYSGNDTERVQVSSGSTVTLKGSEHVLIQGIPTGTNYAVTEIDIPAYWTLVSTDNDKGEIVANETVTVTVINRKDRVEYDGEAVLQVNKEVVGGTIVEGGEIPDHFMFELQDEYGTLIQARSTDEFGSPYSTVTFDPIIYTMEDAGKTFTYYILERQGHDSDVNYDKRIYTAEVTVEDTGTELVTTVVYKLPTLGTAIELDKVVFLNEKFGTIKVLKKDAETGEELAGAKFTIKSGDLYLQADGTLAETEYEFVTGEDGTFTVKKAKAGDYVLHETEAPENHGLAEDVNFTLTNKQILLNEEAVAEIVVEDPRLKADLIIRKVDAETEEPLAGAEFTIKSGDLYLQTDGTLLETPYTFTSGEDGYIKVSDVFAGEFILHEEKAPELYETIEDVSFTIRGEDIVLNGTTVKEIVVKDPRILGDILIRKVDEETKDVLAGAEFTIKSGDQYLQADGSLAEKEYTFTTDANGEIKVSKVHDGSYTLHETKAPKGYDLAKDVTFEVKDTKMMIDGKAVEVIMVNDPRIILADILIRKVDEKTKEVLSGAIFTIREANGLFLQPDGTLSEVVATFTTDAKGEIKVSGVMDGVYTLHESKAPEGYDLAEDITFTVKDAKVLVNGGIVEVIMVNDPKIEIPPKPPVPPTAAR